MSKIERATVFLPLGYVGSAPDRLHAFEMAKNGRVVGFNLIWPEDGIHPGKTYRLEPVGE